MPEDHSTSTRKLAAIMFTDIQGYTALMQEDEAQALGLRNRHREIFNSTTDKYNGTILQYYGDGTLSIFDSALDSVLCGIELQQRFQDSNVPVRIGIHTGDIIISEEDIIGDGVNVASRVESLAVPGSVLISGKLYDEIKNQSSVESKFLKSVRFKNVSDPVKIYAISNEGLVVPDPRSLKGKTASTGNGKRILQVTGLVAVITVAVLLVMGIPEFGSSGQSPKSIAVLPLVNLTGEENQQYMSDGMTDEIIFRLSQVADLERVISRTTVMGYRDTEKTIPDIASELNVTHVLEGSFRLTGDRVKVTVQLIDGESDARVWSETYDRSYDEIFDIQADVASRIVNALESEITSGERDRINRIPTKNTVAYDHYLKGLEYFREWRKELDNVRNVEIALEHFITATELDPGFFEAYLQQFNIHRYYIFYRRDPSQERIDLAREALEKAAGIDPESPEIVLHEGIYAYQVQEDFEGARLLVQEAGKELPNSYEVNYYKALIHRRQGKWNEALEYLDRALQLDPQSYDALTSLIITLIYSRQFEEADSVIQIAMAETPYNQPLLNFRFLVNTYGYGQIPSIDTDPFWHFYYTRNWEELENMILTYKVAIDNQSVYFTNEALVSMANFFAGKSERATELASQHIRDTWQKLKNDYPDDHRLYASLGFGYAFAGEADSAVYYSQKALDLKSYSDDVLMGYQRETDLMKIYVIIGDYDKALEKLEFLLTNPGELPLTVELLKIDALYDPLRELPEYKSLLKKTEYEVKPVVVDPPD